MKGIIVTGHGNFATGVHSAVQVVAGMQENFESVDFLSEDSVEILSEHLNAAVQRLSHCEEILIFTDLIGGSPFKVSAELSLKRAENIRVLSGTNMGMLIEYVCAREWTEADELLAQTLETGKNQIICFQLMEDSDILEEQEGI